MFTRTALPLSRAATATFEELALLFASPEPDEALAPGAAAPPPPSGAAASVSFRGPGHGRMVMAVAPALLPAIAGNMLGADAAPEPRLQHDALGELVNVLCGTLLPELAGTAATFRLAAPEALAPAAAGSCRPGETLAAAARLRLDDGEALALLFAAAAPAGAEAA
jgi:hypothetical protein